MAHKIKEVRENLVNMGNSIRETYEETGDLKAANAAIKAYAVATKTSLVQVQYKKLTGTPKKIDFLEE